MCLLSTGLVPLQCEICNCSNRELAIIQSPARYILGISNWSASGSDFVDFSEVRIRSGGIFSSCFKVNAVSSFLPTFFYTHVAQFNTYNTELVCGLLHYSCNWIHKSNYSSLWGAQLEHRFFIFIIFLLSILHIPESEAAGWGTQVERGARWQSAALRC